MRGLILTGPLGVGKTTAQRILVADHGFWMPSTVTTRAAEHGEPEVLAVSWEGFRAGVAERRYILPTQFGGHWYAWLGSDLARLRGDWAAAAALNVRPYTALLLSGIIPELMPGMGRYGGRV